MSYEKPKNIVEDVAALYANIVESQSEKVEQLDEAQGLTVGPGGFNVGGKPVQSRPSTVFQRPGATPAPKGVAVGPGGFNVGGRPVQSGASSVFQRPGATPAPKGLTVGPGGFNVGGKPVQSGMSSIFKRPGVPASTATTTPTSTGSPAPAAPAGRDVIVKAAKGGVPGTLNKTTGKWTPSAGASTRPPAGGTPTSGKPAPTTPAPTTAPAPVTPQRTFNPLMQRTFGYQTGNAPEQIAAASKNVPQATSDAAFKKSAQMVKSIKPSANLNMELDLFDVIKGHLLDEGYAETEEAAIAIMANMGEAWKKSIIEG